MKKQSKRFNYKKTMNNFNSYIEKNYYIPKNPPKKVFYNWTEWQGWRFYLKALRNLDFKSIWGHIKSEWFEGLR